MTPGEALKTIKAKVTAGEWFYSEHVEKDHPERNIGAAEVKAGILASHNCRTEGTERWRVIGPSLRPRTQPKLVCIVKIESLAIVITAWRIK